MLGSLPPTHLREIMTYSLKEGAFDKIFQQVHFSDISALFFTEVLPYLKITLMMGLYIMQSLVRTNSQLLTL